MISRRTTAAEEEALRGGSRGERSGFYSSSEMPVTP
jgi:hypothetical protein